jgi:hypothetical protein
LIEFPTAIHIPKHTHEKSETRFLLEGLHLFENNVTGERFEVRKGWYFYLPGRVMHEAWVPAGAKATIILESGWKVDWRSPYFQRPGRFGANNLNDSTYQQSQVEIPVQFSGSNRLPQSGVDSRLLLVVIH